MANDKSGDEETPPGSPSLLPWFEELDRTNAANFRGTVNNSNAVGADGIPTPHSTIPFPLFPGENMHGSSNPYATEMPLSDLNFMTDFTPLGNSQSSMLDYGYMFEIGHTPVLPSADSIFLSVEGNTDFGPDNVRNAAFEVSMLQRPFAYSELVTSTDSAEALNNIQQGQVPCTNIASNSERVLLPQSNIVHCQIADGSSLNANPDVAAGVSSVQNSNQIHKPPDMNVLGVEGNWNGRSAFFELNNNFQCYPAVSGVTIGSHQARLPDSGLSRVNELPLLSLNTSTGLSPYDQSEKHYLETDTFLLSDHSAVCPPVAVTRNTSLHDQPGKPSTTNDSIDAQVSGSGIFPQEFSFSPLGNRCQPQVNSSVLSSTNLHKPVMTGSEFPATEVNTTINCSGAFVGSSAQRGAPEISAANSQAQTAFSREDLSATRVGRTIAGTSVKRAEEDTSPATSQSQHRKTRKTQTSTSPCAKTPAPEPSSLQNLSSDASVLRLAPTSPSFICQDQSTMLIQPLSQTRSSLPLQVNSAQLLPPLPQATLPISSRTRSKTSVPPQSQTACLFLPEAKSTTSLPLSSLTDLSLSSEEGSTTATPSLSQNARSLPPHPQTAPPLPSQKASSSTLEPKSSLGSSLPQKSQTTSPLPSNCPTFSSLPPKSQLLLPPQHPTDSQIPPNIIAPPLRPPAQIASPRPRKLRAPPPSQKLKAALPPQPRTGVHIKMKGVDQTQTQQHIGHKCKLCKRDLALTPEEMGRASVLPVAPVVAVLSCGHTFHDHCLQLITPADAAKSPPCIPCAIGDS